MAADRTPPSDDGDMLAITDTEIDSEESVLRELNAALAANPELRAAAPVQGEWEDFDRLIAENPELAAPVASGKKEFYKSKDKWECGHESEETQTAIERDPSDGTPALLLNEVKGICDKCMEKWVKLENDPESEKVELGGSSSGPAGPPSYDQAQKGHELEIENDDEERRPFPKLDIDDGPTKGKGRAGQAVQYDQHFGEDDEDNASIYSQGNSFDSLPPELKVGAQPKFFEGLGEDDDDSDNDVFLDSSRHQGRQDAGKSTSNPRA